MPQNQERDHQFEQSQHGKHVGKHFLRILQLHAVRFMDRLRGVPDRDRGSATFLQGFLRNQELLQRWQTFATEGFSRDTLNSDSPMTHLRHTVMKAPPNHYIQSQQPPFWRLSSRFRRLKAMSACADNGFIGPNSILSDDLVRISTTFVNLRFSVSRIL